MKIYNIDNSKHISTRFGLIILIYCFFFIFGVIMDSGGGHLAPLWMLGPLIYGIPVIATILLIDLIILAYKKEFSLQKCFINLLILGLFIALHFLGGLISF